MPVRVYELSTSRPFEIGEGNNGIDLEYLVRGSHDEAEVDSAILAVLPTSLRGFVFHRRSARPLGGGVWEVSVRYGPPRTTAVEGQGDPTRPPTSQPEQPSGDQALTSGEISWDTTGGTSHITQSVRTRQAVGRDGANAPNFNRAIAVSKDGVGGCDVIAPRMEFQVSVEMPYVTINYIRNLELLTATTNDSLWYAWEEDELLFLGASGRWSGSEEDGKWNVSFRFLAGRNKTATIDIGDGDPIPIQLTDFKPHDFVWVAYEDSESEGAIVQIPKAAYVEVVYEQGDYSLMGLGSGE